MINISRSQITARTLLGSVLLCSVAVASSTQIESPNGQQQRPVILLPSARLGPGPNRENSGIVKSRTHENLFWMINDSGDEPRIYPVRRDGTVVSASESNQPGVLVLGAQNHDWEDIAVDTAGNVVIPDFGNNSNARDDLALYYVREPEPTATQVPVARMVRFRYPDQPSIPAPDNDFNYDSEALFIVEETPYLLTKHRSDSFTKLYRLDAKDPDVVHDLTLINHFDIKGMVTAADCSEDGRRLVVTTYNTIWLFEVDKPGDDYFSGRISTFRFLSIQVEAICFADDDTLILGDERRAELYEVAIDQFVPVQ